MSSSNERTKLLSPPSTPSTRPQLETRGSYQSVLGPLVPPTKPPKRHHYAIIIVVVALIIALQIFLLVGDDAFGVVLAILSVLPEMFGYDWMRSRDADNGMGWAMVSPLPAQTMSGFGASGAWWVNDIIDFPDTIKDSIASLLFSPNGLHLSSYRYNIGAGGVGVRRPARAPESFYDPSTGTYDWTKDHGGLYFLKAAKRYGVPELTAFANSAPPNWVTNGKTCAGGLSEGDESDFAGYLTEVVGHFREDMGISFNHLSPINEPDNPRSECSQEGMSVGWRQRATFIWALRKSLDERGLGDVGILADETGWVLEAIPELPLWLPHVKDEISAVAFHNYDFPTSHRLTIFSDSVLRLTGFNPGEGEGSDKTPPPKPIWMTETCCATGPGTGWRLFGSQYDPRISGGLVLANQVYLALTSGRASYFSWWTALSAMIGCDPVSRPDCVREVNRQGYNDGLIYFDRRYRHNGNLGVYVTKRFWTFAHFTRFVRPGGVLHSVVGGPRDVRVLAFHVKVPLGQVPGQGQGQDGRGDGWEGEGGEEEGVGAGGVKEVDGWNVIAINDASVPVWLPFALPGQRGGLKRDEFERAKKLLRDSPPPRDFPDVDDEGEDEGEGAFEIREVYETTDDEDFKFRSPSHPPSSSFSFPSAGSAGSGSGFGSGSGQGRNGTRTPPREGEGEGRGRDRDRDDDENGGTIAGGYEIKLSPRSVTSVLLRRKSVPEKGGKGRGKGRGKVRGGS